MKPNLFSIATQELSQNAFITWLMQWADPECRDSNPPLADAARDFVKRLVQLQNPDFDEVTKIKAGRQWANIEIFLNQVIALPSNDTKQ